MDTRTSANRLLVHARLRLAGLSLLVMGALLYGSGVAMGRLLLQSQDSAIRRELQALAGTLHDSLKPVLPQAARPTPALVSVLPGLCIEGEPCKAPDSLVERHAISATDSDRYKLSVLDQSGALIASSPGAPDAISPVADQDWQLTQEPFGQRWLTYSIHLHHSNGSGEPVWGFLQISRSLNDLDREAQQLLWLGHGVFVIALLAMGAASWWLAGLAIAPLLEAYQRQEQFSADVAHELRTPLANLLAVVEAERRSRSIASEQPSIQSWDRVLAQGRRLQNLIGDLLLLASLERACEQEQATVCDLAEITADVMEDFAETAAAAQVRVIQTSWMPSAKVLGTESELSRLVINLLSNAIQHSPGGNEIDVSLKRQGRHFRLSITDNGPGIAEEMQGRIFDRFTRLDPARSRGHGGSGLGLAIAQAIARRHHAEIQVQSRHGCGSCFSVIVPAIA
jgi:two-component Ni(II)/redox sensor kinase NrsS